MPFTIQFHTWFPDVISIVDRVDNFKNTKNYKTCVVQLALLQNLTVPPYYECTVWVLCYTAKFV